MQLSRIDRIYAKLPVTAKLADGSPVTISGVDVAALPPRSAPTGTTIWAATSYSAGVATVLLAGPDADSSGAIPIPDSGADLWIRVVDSPEVEAVKVERVIIEGGGAATVPAVTLPVTSVNGRTGGVVLTATDVGLGPAALTAAIDAEIAAQGGGGASDATTTSKGVVQLAGDLAGIAAAPTVPGLAGKLAAGNNLSDVASAATARSNLGLATVATSGAYADLTGKPTIPAGPTIVDNGTYVTMTVA